jgi:hypothetical protein
LDRIEISGLQQWMVIIIARFGTDEGGLAAQLNPKFFGLGEPDVRLLEPNRAGLHPSRDATHRADRRSVRRRNGNQDWCSPELADAGHRSRGTERPASRLPRRMDSVRG